MNALPAYLQNRQSKGLAQSLVANLGVGSPPFLSIMGNRLTLIDGVGEEIAVTTYDPKIGPYLDCVIIDALERTSKIYYDKAFDPGANQYEPPACFSDNGIAPSRNAGKPQSATCASCPQSAWGSKVSQVSGKGVKACADIQKIAILVPGYEMPFLCRVPPNSRTNFRGYVNKFVGQPIDVCDVTTRISFEPGGIGTLHFDAVGYIAEDVFGQREKLMAAKATDSMIGRTDLPREGGAPIGAAIAPQQIEHQPQMQPQPSPAQSQQAPQQPAPQTRRRRNTAEAAPMQQPAAPTQAPFQPATTAAPFQPQAQGIPATPNANFGMAEGAKPDAGLQSTLDSLFKK